MKIKAAIFGSICDQCEKPILNKKGIALVDGKQSKTFCRKCYATEIKKSLPKMNLTDEVLATLTPREAKVMRMFQDGIAIEDLAKHFKVTFDRMLQIKGRALRKLRHDYIIYILAIIKCEKEIMQMPKYFIDTGNGAEIKVSDTGSGGECLVTLSITINHQETEIFLTSDEARKLAEFLVKEAEIVEI